MTVSQEIATSGWWFISSAGSTRLRTKLTEPTKSPRLKLFAIAEPSRSQPGCSDSLASTSASSKGAIAPMLPQIGLFKL